MLQTSKKAFRHAGRLFETAVYGRLSLVFIKRISVKTAKRCWRHIWQDVGPDWEGRVRKFQTNPSRGFSRGSEKLSQKYAFSDFENFRPKMLYNGEAQEQSALNHHRSPLKLVQ